MRLALTLIALCGVCAPAAAQGPVPNAPAAPARTDPSPDAPSAAPPQVTFPGGYQLEALGSASSERLDVGTGRALGLQAIVASVQEHHPALIAARAELEAARGDQLSAEGGFDTQLSARGFAAPLGYYDWARADVMLEQPTPLWGATVYGGWRIGRGDVPGYYGGYETLDLGEARVGVRVPLLRGGPIDSRRARIWSAERTTRAQEASLQSSVLTLQLAAAAAYWSWVAAGQRYAVASELLALAETRDSQIASRVRSGALPAIESLENRRVILGRRTSLVSARRALERAAIGLSLYLRSDSGAPRVPSARRVPLQTDAPGRLEVSLPDEVEGAWTRRPDLEAYRARLERQRVSVDLAENQLLPQVDIGVAGAFDLGAGTDDQQTRLGPPVLEASVSISMPLQLREARGAIRRETAELSALRAQAQLVRDRVATQVQDAHSAVMAAQERAELARQTAEVAEAVAEAERRRFALGATQLFIVNLREQSAAASRAVLIDARAALQQAQAQWRAATARPLVN